MSLPPYLDPEVRKLDFSTRAKLIYNYHIELNKIRYESQLKSRKFIKWGSPIEASSKFKGSLLKENEETVLYSLRSNSKQNTRLSKSKNNEDGKESIQDDFDTLNEIDEADSPEKENVNYLRKRNSPPEINTSISQSKISKLESEEQMQEKEQTVSKNQKHTNEEIMKRSKLFSSITPSKRTEEIMQNGINENKHIEKKEEEILRFESSLRDASDEEQLILSDNEIEEPEKEVVFRKRIPPPLYGTGKRTHQSTSFSNPKRTRYNSSENFANYRSAENKITSTTDEIAVEKVDDIPCPLCNLEFSQNEIEEHASNCGIMQNSEVTMSKNMIKCETCDNYFELNTNFEVHVKDCIRAQRRRTD